MKPHLCRSTTDIFQLGFDLNLLAVVFTLIFSLLVNKSDAQDVSPNSSESVVVEHIELRLDKSERDQVKAYIVIWNGTRSPANLTSVESKTFDSVSILKPTIENGIKIFLQVVDLFSIPSRSELVMKPSGVHLVLSNPSAVIAVGDFIQIQLTFDNGNSLRVKGVLSDEKAPLIDHHHGGEDKLITR